MGGGYSMYEMFYAGPKRDVENWMRVYSTTAEGTANVKDRWVSVDWDIMKVPPTNKPYEVVVLLGTENSSVIQNLGDNTQPGGIWGKFQTAQDWEDYSRIRYTGVAIHIPDDIKPGEYTLLYYILFETNYGTQQVRLAPIKFKI